MIYSPARWIQAHLIEQGLASNPDTVPLDAWPIYLALLPDDGIDNAIAIYDVPGKKDGRDLRGGTTIIHPGLMIYVRATRHDDAYDRMMQISAKLDAIKNTLITIGTDNTTFSAASQRPIMNVGEVPGTRPRVAFNLIATLSYAHN